MTMKHPDIIEPDARLKVPDVTRRVYGPISKKQAAYVDEIKRDFNTIIAKLNRASADLGTDRMMALAKNKTEEASMWAVKSITRFIPAEHEAAQGSPVSVMDEGKKWKEGKTVPLGSFDQDKNPDDDLSKL